MRLDSVAIVLFVWKNAVQCWGGRVGEWESRRGAQNSKKNVCSESKNLQRFEAREFLNTL
jgi:hypothetical protein